MHQSGRSRVPLIGDERAELAMVTEDKECLRVLYVHRIGSRDGQSVHIDGLIAALRRAGHQVLIVGPRAYENVRFGDDSRLVFLIRTYLPRGIGELAELAYNIPAYLRMRQICRTFKPDLVYERYNLFFLAGALLARRCNIPFYLEVNAPLADERGRFGGLAFGRLARVLERFTWRSARRVFAVTEVLKGIVVGAGVPAHRVEVTPNGIDREQFAPPAKREPGAGVVVLGFVGFVRAWHGLDAVITQVAAYQGPTPVKLVIVGDGPAFGELQRQAAALEITDRVRFVGVAERSAIPSLVSSFDIALQPRVVSYASPLKIFEYMAAGCAIVAPDQPNIREILINGQTAMLFPPDDEAAMWSAVERLLTDKSLRHELGRAARETIVDRDYTWSANARRIVALAGIDLRRAGGSGHVPCPPHR